MTGGGTESVRPVQPPLDVAIIGAGFSGICMAIKLRQAGIEGFRILEKTNGIGGTWYENTYPGAACDVPSHFYCYSFEPKADWSRVYSPQPEIQQYLEDCVDKYELRDSITHGAHVKGLQLIEEQGHWLLTFDDGSSLTARHVVNGGGGLHVPRTPDFAGMDDFRGVQMHTARWDHSVDMRDKRVAIIGSAASAIQIIPELAKVVSELTVLQRTPNYIVPRFDRAYSAREKNRFRRWPWFQRLYRWLIYKRLDVVAYPITRANSWRARLATRALKKHMKAEVRDASLHASLTPAYQLGCKRILLSDDLYKTLNEEHVSLVVSPIERIVADGVQCAGGKHISADVIVYATGFDIEAQQFSLDIRGRDGNSLEDLWKKEVSAYFGCCVAGMPNYWMMTGPNTGVGTTSVVFMLEKTADYIVRMIRSAGPGELVEPKDEAQRRYNEGIDKDLEGSVWATGCKSWYITDSSRIETLYPGSALAFQKQMQTPIEEDFHRTGTKGVTAA